MPKNLSLVAFFLFVGLIPNTLIAQNIFQISGIVFDETTKKPLSGATISLISRQASTQFTTTDQAGKFEFKNLNASRFLLKITFIGFEDIQMPLTLDQANTNLGNINLKPKSATLGEVKIEAKGSTATQKNDTVQYNAGSFKVEKDATSEDLIRKMPSVVVENGQVKAQGENVQKVLVDGKEFFGNDPSTALKTLPAEVVESVQVFDQLGDQAFFTGFDDGNRTKTMNIITKASKRNGNFGKIYAGYGSQERYESGANFNYFKGNKKITLLAMSNNINQQNFAFQDLFSATGGGGQGGMMRGGSPMMRGGGGMNMRMMGGGVSNFIVGNQNGITQTHVVGINYSDVIGKKTNFSSSYFFNWTDNRNNQITDRNTFLANNTSQNYNQSLISEAKNQNHRFNLRLEHKFDTANTIILSPRLTVQQYDGDQNTQAKTTIGIENTALNQTENQTKTKNLGYNFSNDLLYKHAFRKKGRTFSINLNTQANSRQSETFLLANNTFFKSNQTKDSLNIDQKSPNQTQGYTLGTNVAITEMLSKNSQIQVDYNISYTKNDADKRTFNYDFINYQYAFLDTNLSNVFVNDYLANRIGGSYRYRDNAQKMLLSVGIAYQNAQLINEQAFPKSDSFNKIFDNILPNASLQYTFSKKKNVRINYRTSTNAPSVSQLQNVIDNSNPLNLRTGNADLKQEYSHNITIRYAFNDAQKSTSFFAVANLIQTQNYIANANIVAKRDTLVKGVLLNRGSQISLPINVDGYFNARTFAMYAFPIAVLKLNANLNSGLSYSRIPSLINNTPNLSNTYNLNSGVSVGSNISEKIDFSVAYNLTYNIVKNSIQTQTNGNFVNQSANARLNWTFWKGIVFRNEINFTAYSGLGDGFNQSFVLWNASIAKKIFKNEVGEIKLSVFDLLNQNNQISRNATETYIEDSQSNVLTHYLMLTFTYNFRKFNASPTPNTPNGLPVPR